MFRGILFIGIWIATLYGATTWFDLSATPRDLIVELRSSATKGAPVPATPAVGVNQRRYGPGDEFQDCPDCPEMVVIPAGSFRMGDLTGEGDEDEKPVHIVRVGYSFAIGKYEVTYGEYSAFVNSTGHSDGSGCRVWANDKGEEDNSKNWRDPGFIQSHGDPVVCVNWNDATAYAQWLSHKTGRLYRLLSESEWEYVARAGSQTKYGFGNGDTFLCRYGNIADKSSKYKWRNNNCDDGYARHPAPVGSFTANQFGVHDMHGNLWEWVADCWHASYSGAPSNGSTWKSRRNCSKRVLRGGSWISGPGDLRSANRDLAIAGKRSDIAGFRIARMLSQ